MSGASANHVNKNNPHFPIIFDRHDGNDQPKTTSMYFSVPIGFMYLHTYMLMAKMKLPLEPCLMISLEPNHKA